MTDAAACEEESAPFFSFWIDDYPKGEPPFDVRKLLEVRDDVRRYSWNG